MCYVKCQNILVNILVHLLQRLNFWLRYPSYLLSKFATQLKLIQSVVWVEIHGICFASSTFRVLLSGFWVSGLQYPSPRDPFPVPVPGFPVPGSQSPRVPGPRIPGVRVPGSRVAGSWGPGSQVSGSQVLILDYP